MHENLPKDLRSQAPDDWRITLERSTEERDIAFVLQLEQNPIVTTYQDENIDFAGTKIQRNRMMDDQALLEESLGPIRFYSFCRTERCQTLRELTFDEHGIYLFLQKGSQRRGKAPCGHWI